MKTAIKITLVVFLLLVFAGCVGFYGLMTGRVQFPSDLTKSARSAETLYAKVTADIHSVDIELTEMAFRPESVPLPTPSVNSKNWLDHFLSNPTCQVPCWENVTPNATDLETAKKIIAAIPGVRIISLEPHSVTWYFEDDSSKSGHIVADPYGTVVQIDLKLGNDQKLLLSDVVEAYGKPDSIGEGMDCDHILAYRSQGMLLSAADPSCRRNPEVDIQPATLINRIILFSPDNQDYTRSVFNFNLDEILWNGYGKYDFRNP